MPLCKRWCAIAAALLALSCRGEAPATPDTGVRERALSLLEHTRAIAMRMKDRRFHAELFAQLSRAYSAVGTPEAMQTAGALAGEGIELMKKIGSPEDRELAASRLAIAEASAGAFDRALELAAGVRSVEEKSSVLARIAAIAAQSRSADPAERAAELAAKIPLEDDKGAAFAAAAGAAANAGRFELADELARRCVKPERRAEAYASIARAQIARKSWRAAEELARGIESVHWRGEAQSALVAAYYGSGQHELAEKKARAIESSWLQARAYAEMARLAHAGGSKPRADALFAKARAIAEGIHDGVMQAAAMEDVAARALAMERSAQAQELAEKCPAREAKHRVLAKLAEHHAKAGRFQEAEAAARRIDGDPLAAADALGAIAIARAERGEDGHALELIAEIPTLELRLVPAARVIARSTIEERPLTSVMLANLARLLEAEARPSVAP